MMDDPVPPQQTGNVDLRTGGPGPRTFATIPTADQQRIKANIALMQSKGAKPEEIDDYLGNHEHLQPVAPSAPEKPQAGLLSRAGSVVSGAVSGLIHDPIGVATAPIKSLQTMLAPGVGEARPDARLSKGGNSSGRAIDTTPYDAEHGGVTTAERTAGGLQTAANAAFPGLAELAGSAVTRLGGGAVLSKLLGLGTAGSAAGATYDPKDPAAGALAGFVLAPTLHGAGKAVGAVGDGLGAVGSKVADVAGRPAETRTLNVGPVKLGAVKGVSERAAELNAASLKDTPAVPSATDKPLAPIDQSVTAMRLARGLKTASPAAETVLRDALTARSAGAVDRVIQHGLESTGLLNREDGLQTVDDLIEKRSADANENFPKTFAAHPEPLTNPVYDEIAKTPAGQQALKRGSIIAANRGEKIASMDELMGAPEGIRPEDWANMQRMAQERGIPLPTVPGAKKITPTLQQAHFIKLGFDDMLNSAPEPGSGGSGPNNAAAVAGLKKRWLAAMDSDAPTYGSDRKQFADQSDLIRAGETGRNLWKMHPSEAAKAFAEMSDAERQVARRTGFDALADRIENGPADVDKGVSKPRDMKRMRLLFADDASFKNFQDGLKQEAQMHATSQSVLGGSNTADKLSDMAGMAGITLPDVLKAATGHPMPVLRKGAAALLRKAGNQSADDLAAARARLLVQGTDRVPTPPAPPADVPVTPDAPVPESRWLPAGRFETGDTQSQAMPIPQPAPMNRRLGPGVTYQGVAGDAQHSTAMPIRQPLPLNRRLLSGGPAATPTVGDVQQGPGIPSRGQSLEAAVQTAMDKIFRANPKMAVSLTREQQQALESEIRARIGRGEVF